MIFPHFFFALGASRCRRGKGKDCICIMDLLSGINGVEMTQWLGTRAMGGGDDVVVVKGPGITRVFCLLLSTYTYAYVSMSHKK